MDNIIESQIQLQLAMERAKWAVLPHPDCSNELEQRLQAIEAQMRRFIIALAIRPERRAEASAWCRKLSKSANRTKWMVTSFYWDIPSGRVIKGREVVYLFADRGLAAAFRVVFG